MDDKPTTAQELEELFGKVNWEKVFKDELTAEVKKQLDYNMSIILYGTPGEMKYNRPMKIFQFDKHTYQDGEVNHTWQFGIIKNRALLWVWYETPGGIVHSAGGINILFSFFSSSLMSIDIQQQRFSLAFGFLVEYFDD